MTTPDIRLIVRGDYNDGDYDTRITRIGEHNQELLQNCLPLIETIMTRKGHNFYTIGFHFDGPDYPTQMYGDRFPADLIEAFREEFVPFGGEQYVGIHTIDSIELQEVNTLKLWKDPRFA